jgi:hypothetical protein
MKFKCGRSGVYVSGDSWMPVFGLRGCVQKMRGSYEADNELGCDVLASFFENLQPEVIACQGGGERTRCLFDDSGYLGVGKPREYSPADLLIILYLGGLD